MTQTGISEQNAEFWDELCGTQLAKSIGVKDSSPESLDLFDKWYFDFYPYLEKHIPFNSMEGKDVLEVGLGYGSVSQRLAISGANYQGLDIANGPVSMVNHRLQQNELSGKAQQGSILEPPFKKESFDIIVAIGCLHHTGDLKVAIDQCRELLRPNGFLIMMVYYAYSYRRWVQAPILTFKYAVSELFGQRDVVGKSRSNHRSAYDVDSAGRGAPHTDWISRKSLESLCSNYSSIDFTLENIDQEHPFKLWSRNRLLKTQIPSWMGLDVYVKATK